jgi:PIN domain nuclease of toxin-antitoxin system
LDTHAWARSLIEEERLSPAALAAIAGADAIFVSPVSFFEIAQKVRLGKWPEMAALVGELQRLLGQQGGFVANVDPAICVAAGMMDWSHGDLFDRLLAATSAQLALPLVSADPVFDQIATRIW